MNDAKARVLAVFSGSWFESDGTIETASTIEMTFTSREGGNGTDCEPDPGTMAAARSLRAAIKTADIRGVTARLDTCDEWVSVSVIVTIALAL